MIDSDRAFKMMAQLDAFPIPNAISMIEHFIFKVKGKRVVVRPDFRNPLEVHRFERAITIASNYFLSL
jgi:hypothetical protein